MLHLHIHSYFSMMWGTAPIEVLAKKLIERGQTVFPLTDRNSMHGMVEHLRTCQKFGLRPIVGAQLVHRGEDVLCLVKTQQGYRHLCRLLTGYYRDPRWCLSEALEELHEGLILITQDETIISQLYPTAEVYVDLHPGAMAQANALHRKYKCPLVATSQAYMISPKAWPLHQMLRAIDTNSKLSRIPQGELVSQHSYLLSKDEMDNYFEAYPEAVKATYEIAEACTFAPTPGKLIFPPSEDEHGFHTLREKTYAGLSRRYERVHEEVRRRADYELDMIRRKHFSNCFLVIEDVVRRFPLTCGRGSAAASIVSYALGITHVDPIAHNLFFERFLNPGRIDPPDIDIDFAWDERDRVRDYLWEKYGRNHIAMVCNQNRLRPRSALREIAKVYGLGDKEVADISHKLIKARRSKKKVQLPEPWPHILKMAKRLEDYPRHISVHCGGVVITPDEITNHCPLRPMPIGYDVIPWEKDGAEDYGFVKLDFLGNRSLAVIRDTLKSIDENYGVPVRYDTLNPLGDPQTQSLIESGNTMGCFYVESPATRQLLQKVNMGDFETLVAVSSIIRPAANRIATQWVERHRWIHQHGGEPNWKEIHPDLEETLEETHGLMVYQEDVTRTAMVLAGFDATQGDKLRKIISKKNKEEQLRDYQQKFYQGCRNNGLTDEQIKDVWDMILSFAGYSFCKPHSASYAMVSYKSAFLKFHYPAEFLAAVISNQGGFYSSFAYLSHARRMGIRVLGPHINESRICWHGRQGKIRVGFSRIKGLRKDTMTSIMAERRQGGSFHSLDHFLHRVDITLEETKRLILAGCFDEVESDSNRPSLNWRALYWFARHKRQAEDLFPDYIKVEDLPVMEPYSSRVRLSLERKLLGFWLSKHPLKDYRECLHDTPTITARDVPNKTNRRVQLAGWLITGKTVLTKHDEPMSFLTFEDETDIYETVMFPDLYRKCVSYLDYNRPYLVTGEVVSDHGAICINLQNLQRLDLPHRASA